MTLSTSEWIGLIGIVIAIIFGILTLLKKESSSKNNINISQKAAPFSNGKQKQNVKINTDD